MPDYRADLMRYLQMNMGGSAPMGATPGFNPNLPHPLAGMDAGGMGDMGGGGGGGMPPSGPPPIGPQQPMQANTQQPGVLKSMLMDFSLTMREALQRELGVPTDSERKKIAEQARLAAARDAREEVFKNAQMQNMRTDNERQQADAEQRRRYNEALIAKAQKEKETDPYQGLSGEARLEMMQELSPDERVREAARRSMSRIRESKPSAQAKSPTQLDIETQAIKGDATAKAILEQQQKRALARSSANRSANTFIVRTVDEEGNPVTKVVPKTVGAEYAAQPSVEARKSLRQAQRGEEIGKQIITDAEKHPEWLGGVASVFSGGGGGGVVGSVKEKTGIIGKDEARFRTRVSQEFTTAAHDMFGSAFTGTELQRALDSIPNTKMSPVKFRESVEQTIENMQRAQRILGMKKKKDNNGNGRKTRFSQE